MPHELATALGVLAGAVVVLLTVAGIVGVLQTPADQNARRPTGSSARGDPRLLCRWCRLGSRWRVARPGRETGEGASRRSTHPWAAGEKPGPVQPEP